MATTVISPALQKGSDSFVDYCCSVCEDNGTLKEAQFYCENCSKWYCDQCVSLHDQMYKKHITLGRSDKGKWPLAKDVANMLLQCEEHKGKIIEMFCEDHGQLCCSTCVLLDHRQCNKVSQLASEVHKKVHEDLHKLTADIAEMKQRLQKLIEQRECNIKSLQQAYDNILEEIAFVRQKFNEALDLLEKSSIKEGKDLLNRLQESLKTDVDPCKNALKRIQFLQEATDKIGRHDSELSTIAFIKIQKELLMADSLLRTSAFKSDITLSFTPNKEIQKCFATVTTLGNILANNSNQIITVAQKNHFNVNLTGELSCEIRGICEMSNGNILLTDYRNKEVKMLDKDYHVISHCSIPECPIYVCQISDDIMAVAVYNWSNVHQIYFLSVTNGSLMKKKTFNLPHPCIGICHVSGQLYVTSGAALYRYTLTGTLLDKLYEDTSSTYAVYRCAVNACGDRIYVVNHIHHKVLTLNMSGQVLATFTDAELQHPIDVHVTGSGQVLVCGNTSKNIIQINSEGTEKIASVASLKDGSNVLSVCCSKRTGCILVGRSDTDDIVVFDTK